MAIGARSQSARTYLEKNLDCFMDGKWFVVVVIIYRTIATVDELIDHGLIALRECLPNDAELTSKVVLCLLSCLCSYLYSEC